MLGRGLMVNPSLVQQIKGEKELTKEYLKEFHDTLCNAYADIMYGDRNVLFKMKELWFYMGNLFPENKKYMKKIKKTQKLEEYKETVNEMFTELHLEIPQ